MIQATIHQGHSKFQANGTQCMANAFAAVVESYNTPLKSWSQETLDSILESGDLLYAQHGDASQKYFMIEDFKSECDGFYHAINFGTAFTGSTMDKESSYPYFTLEKALGGMHKCVFTMGSGTPSYSTAIIHDQDKYYMFDPHSRNDAVMPSPDDTAVVSIHKSLSDLCLFIRHLSASIDKSKNIPFEAVSVTVLPDNTMMVESDFEGFSDSDVSDGDLSCRLFMAQEHASDVSSVSSVSSVDILDDLSSLSSINLEDITELSSVRSVSPIDIAIDVPDIQDLNDSATFIESINIDVFNDSYEIEHVPNSVHLRALSSDQTGPVMLLVPDMFDSQHLPDSHVGHSSALTSTDHTNQILRSVNQTTSTDCTDQTLRSDAQTTSTECTDQTLHSDAQMTST
ncbi:hypothetical protein DPMN_117728 [Dreissena polymorpha]|uniref:Peptidase C76 domain-containing protein n=1 Tax=Dreissena polymorpha TaxID=45954 RepID=A0A9D4JL14_DREPO|nr:hypothetical protein DPMN_117728 [Dreissena polymorpha]